VVTGGRIYEYRLLSRGLCLEREEKLGELKSQIRLQSIKNVKTIWAKGKYNFAVVTDGGIYEYRRFARFMSVKREEKLPELKS
jgi:hypothetical protein